MSEENGVSDECVAAFDREFPGLCGQLRADMLCAFRAALAAHKSEGKG